MTSKAKTFNDDGLQHLSPNLTPQEIAQQNERVYIQDITNSFVLGFLVGLFVYCILSNAPYESQFPHLKVVSMNFVAELNNNNSTTQQSHYVPFANARWDLSIGVPKELVGNYICLHGNLQASFLYKNVTLVTSSLQSYSKLDSGTPQIFTVSANATGENLSGAIGKEIMDAIKERNVVRFGSRLYLTDCRTQTKTWTMGYECDAPALRFELESDHIKGTAFQEDSRCIINH